ncbi:hypothetical protein C8J57DRAFT_1502033 [Mycena rebaudengoi]|nr:hypothetical protein C8J57DRAFT_1502033 [Mycena rebaudengoi]
MGTKTHGALFFLSSHRKPQSYRAIFASSLPPDRLQIFGMLSYRNRISCGGTLDTFVDKQSALQDLYALFSSELSTIYGVEWTQRDELCRVLAEKADGSFEWAASACVFINDLGHLPTEQLSLVLSHPEVVCPSNYRATMVSPEHGATKSPSAYLRGVWHFVSSDGGRTSNRVDPPLMERSHHPHLFAFFHGKHRNDSRTPSRNSHPGDFNDNLDACFCARPRGPRHLGIHPFPLAELDPLNFPRPTGLLGV